MINKQKNKVATFYHPSIQKYHDGEQNELGEISKLEKHVSEVAFHLIGPIHYKKYKQKSLKI
jgi:hypothetical protein